MPSLLSKAQANNDPNDPMAYTMMRAHGPTVDEQRLAASQAADAPRGLATLAGQTVEGHASVPVVQYDTFSPENISRVARQTAGDVGLVSQDYADGGDGNLGTELLGAFLRVPVKGVMTTLDAMDKANYFTTQRPLSTLVQAAAADNPLYRDNAGPLDFLGYLGDIRQMWNTSEYMTPGRAFQQFGLSAMHNMPGAAPLPSDWNLLFAVDQRLNPYTHNPYDMSREDYEKMWDDGTILGRVASGAGDAAAQIATSAGVGVAGTAMRSAVGLTSKVSAAKTLPMVRGWFDGTSPNSWISQQADRLVETTSVAEALQNPILAKSVNKTRLARLIADTTDRGEVANLVLADLGDINAMRTLIDQSPSKMWALTNMNEKMLVQMAHGMHLTDAEEAMLHGVYDDAVSASARDKQLFDMWFTKNAGKEGETGAAGMYNGFQIGAHQITMGGKDNAIGSIVGTVYGKFHDAKMAALYGDPANATWHTIRLGNSTIGSPVTVLARWMGGRRAIGMADISGARPGDALDEVMAQSNSLGHMRGNRAFLVTKYRQGKAANTAVAMTGDMWRAHAAKRIADAELNGGLAKVLEDLDAEITSTLLHRYHVSESDVQAAVESVRKLKAGSAKEATNPKGFFDPAVGRVVLDPQFVAELPNHHVFTPFADLDRQLRSVNGAPRYVRMAGEDADAASVVEELSRSYLERQKAFSKTTANVSKFADKWFESVMRWWRTALLYRVSYTLKNSVVEPLISSFIAHGNILGPGTILDASKEIARNYMDNWGRRAAQSKNYLAGKVGKDQVAAARREVEQLHAEHAHSQVLIATREAELRNMDMLYSPAQKAQVQPLIEQALREAKAERARLQRALDRSHPGWKMVQEKTALDYAARVHQLRSRKKLGPRLRKELNDALRKADLSLLGVDDMTNTMRSIQELEAKVARLESEAVDKATSVTDALARQERARARALGGDTSTFTVTGADGTTSEVMDLFHEDAFGAARRGQMGSEFSQSQTQNAHFAQEYAERLTRTGGVGPIDASDPRYFAEVAWTANRLRQDPLARQILGGATWEDLMRWFNTAEGQEYGGKVIPLRGSRKGRAVEMPMEARYEPGMENVPYAPRVESVDKYLDRKVKASRYQTESLKDLKGEQFEAAFQRNRKVVEAHDQARAEAYQKAKDKGIIHDLDGEEVAVHGEIADHVRAVIERINNTFPSLEAQALILKGPVTESEMMRVLTPIKDRLLPVSAGEVVNMSADTRFRRGLDAIWQNLAVKPENRIGRFPFARREFTRQMRSRIDFLEAQGIKATTPEQLNALRHGAVVDTMREVEATFYNIRRYSNPVYAARWVMGFPGAYYNSLYRYARLAALNPGRSMLVANAWKNLYVQAGVDKYGNHVKDWKDARAMDLGFLLPQPIADALHIDKRKVRMGLDSWNFAVQPPSATFAVTIPVTSFLQTNPQVNSLMQKALGYDPTDTSGSPQGSLYEFFFPFGSPGANQPIGQITLGGVTLDASSLVPSQLQSLAAAIYPGSGRQKQVGVQLFQARVAQWEADKAKGIDSPMPTPEQAGSDAVAFLLLRALAGEALPLPVQLSPEGTFYRDELHRLRDQAGDVRAGDDDFIAMYGDELSDAGATWFTKSTSSTSGGVPATSAAHTLLASKSGAALAHDLMQINENDPSALQVMFGSDSNQQFDQSVYNAQFRSSIPGQSEPIRVQLTPEEWAAKEQTSMSWDVYNQAKTELDIELRKRGFTSLNQKNAAPLKAIWTQWVQEFTQRPENEAWRAEYESSGASGKSAEVVRGIDKTVGSAAFMADNPNEYTAVLADYARFRQEANERYMQAQSPEERQAVVDIWSTWVDTNLTKRSKGFETLWNRYLAPKIDPVTGSSEARDLGPQTLATKE